MSERHASNESHDAALDGRVLEFTVDEGAYAIHLHSVIAISQREVTPTYSLSGRTRRVRRFLIHRGEPALVVSLRLALGFDGNEPPRDGYLVLRSGPLLIAVPIDASVGLDALDFGSRAPLASAVVRDGGLPIGHLIEIEARPVVLLDPNRLLDHELRAEATTAAQSAVRFIKRQERIAELWSEIAAMPAVPAVQHFGRLCRRNGRPKAAAAVRHVLRHLEPGAASGEGPGSQDGVFDDRLLGEVLALAGARRTGELIIDTGNGAGLGSLMLRDGQLVAATVGGDWGEPALRRLLALGASESEFAEVAAPEGAPQFAHSTVASMLSALEQLAAEPRLRRGRATTH